MPIQDQVGPLRRVYVRAPEPEALPAWRDYGWHARPDPAEAAAEHLAFREALEAAGAEVVSGSAPSGADPDAIYVYDPVLMTDRGAILLRPGKPGRRSEPALARADLASAGIPVVAALRELLSGGGVEVLAFDLPHLGGPAACVHLLSFLSPLDTDLVVAFLPQLPVRLVQVLREREVGIVEVPEEELDSMGPNVLALAPRIALALEGNPITRARMEEAGVEVRTYAGRWISRAGDGGPTCLTRPLERG